MSGGSDLPQDAAQITARLRADIEASRPGVESKDLPKAPLQRSCKFAMALGIFIIAMSSLTGLYFALAPLFRGQGFAEFLNFLIVPLGLTGLAVTPGALLYFTARHIQSRGAGLGSACIIFIMALPWLIYAVLGIVRGFALWQILGLIFVSGLALWWAALIFVGRTVKTDG